MQIGISISEERNSEYPRGFTLTVVEIQRRHLGAAVIDQSGSGDETRHRRNRDDMAFLRLQHAGQKLLDQDEVGSNVDFEDSVCAFGSAFKEGCAGG